MKYLVATILIIYFTLSYAQAQIVNSGFESVADTLTAKPSSWVIKPIEGYTVNVNNQDKYAGNQSLLIQGIGTYQSISQIVPIHVNQLKRMAITCHVKAKEVSGSVQLFCQIWNSKGKVISYQNSQMQDAAISGTNDWKKLTLKITADTNAKQLTIGAQLKGKGIVWLDSFVLEEQPQIKSEPSKELVKFAREVTGIIKKRAIYADSVNWQAADKGIQELMAYGLTTDESPQILDFIISRLRLAGDKHSNYHTKTIAQNYATRNSVVLQPAGRLLKGNIGYIILPAFGSISDTASLSYATRIQNLIMDLDTKHDIKGWVVDMRQNSGGNLYPMIAGLGPLTGEGTLGYFVYPGIKNNKGNAWIYEKGTVIIAGTREITVAKPYVLRNQENRIAVLIGPNTGSSGEMTTLCFAGKPNVRLFGEPTAGYMTTNQSIKLSTGAYLYLATGYAADRNGKEYMVDIQPDLRVIANQDKHADPVLDTAVQWLQD